MTACKQLGVIVVPEGFGIWFLLLRVVPTVDQNFPKSSGFHQGLWTFSVSDYLLFPVHKKKEKKKKKESFAQTAEERKKLKHEEGRMTKQKDF